MASSPSDITAGEQVLVHGLKPLGFVESRK
jgi:hypothetical protein